MSRSSVETPSASANRTAISADSLRASVSIADTNRAPGGGPRREARPARRRPHRPVPLPRRPLPFARRQPQEEPVALSRRLPDRRQRHRLGHARARRQLPPRRRVAARRASRTVRPLANTRQNIDRAETAAARRARRRRRQAARAGRRLLSRSAEAEPRSAGLSRPPRTALGRN